LAATKTRLGVPDAIVEILRWEAREKEAQNGQAVAGYGQLTPPPPGDMAELRRRQAEFRETTEELDRRNSWMAIPALAPALALLGAEGAAVLGARAWAGGAGVSNRPLTLLEREPWWRNSPPLGPPLGGPAKTAIREKARKIWARAHNKTEAKELGADVHHSDPLQWAHLKPGADPNRLANLWALSPEAHVLATSEWAKFARAFKEHAPTPAQVMEAKMRIDKLVAEFVRRPGATSRNPSRSRP
jgi:hypothetical protein